MTELVTDSDRTPDGEAASTSISEAVSFGEHEPQLARARDDAEPTGDPEDDASEDTDSDALRVVYGAASRAGGAFRTALAGPAAWPVIIRRHPSVAEVWQHGRTSRGWDSESMAARWAVRAFWISDALWETGCMTARVWFRTRITWAITILLAVAYVVWGR